jgi:hypothetical protein
MANELNHSSAQSRNEGGGVLLKSPGLGRVKGLVERMVEGLVKAGLRGHERLVTRPGALLRAM